MLEPAETAFFVADLAAEAPHVDRGIHSQTLYDGADLRLVLFAFAPGEELSEHTAARPAVVHVLDGEGEAVVGGQPHAVGPGAWFRMPARMATRSGRGRRCGWPSTCCRSRAERGARRRGRFRDLRHV